MKKYLFIFTIISFFIASFLSCKKNEAAPNQPVNHDNTVINTPINSQYLGKLLFYDPILSGNKNVACATCHHPDFAYSDGRDLSIGVNGVGLGPKREFLSPTFHFTKRNSMTILNTAFNGMDEKGKYDSTKAPMFWDSRVQSLETQALAPIMSDLEMRANAYPEALALDSVVARLRNIAEYRTMFSTVFGGEQPVTAVNIARAIAAFERTLVSMNSPFDRYNRGDITAMSALQIQGMNSFRVEGCGNCHSGNMFSDYKLHVLSVPDNARLPNSDTGVNGSYAFRTPSLRNLKWTAPYMHNGAFKTLDEVLEFYDKILEGKSQNTNVSATQIDPLVSILRFNRNQRAAVIAFINALTDENFDVTVPKNVPSKLRVGGNIN